MRPLFTLPPVQKYFWPSLATSRLNSLSFAELSVYTATWVCGVMYALYSLYLASMERVRRSDFR